MTRLSPRDRQTIRNLLNKAIIDAEIAPAFQERKDPKNPIWTFYAHFFHALRLEAFEWRSEFSELRYLLAAVRIWKKCLSSSTRDHIQLSYNQILYEVVEYSGHPECDAELNRRRRRLTES